MPVSASNAQGIGDVLDKVYDIFQKKQITMKIVKE